MDKWMALAVISALAGGPARAGWEASDRAAYDAAKTAQKNGS